MQGKAKLGYLTSSAISTVGLYVPCHIIQNAFLRSLSKAFSMLKWPAVDDLGLMPLGGMKVEEWGQ